MKGEVDFHSPYILLNVNKREQHLQRIIGRVIIRSVRALSTRQVQLDLIIISFVAHFSSKTLNTVFLNKVNNKRIVKHSRKSLLR